MHGHLQSWHRPCCQVYFTNRYNCPALLGGTEGLKYLELPGVGVKQVYCSKTSLTDCQAARAKTATSGIFWITSSGLV